VSHGAIPTPEATIAAARSVTKAASRQTYYTIRWLVDRDLVDDAYLAYAYYRWVDDTIDAPSAERGARLEFLARQKRLLAGDTPLEADLAPQERILVELLRRRRASHPGLDSYLKTMMSVMEFDAGRRGRLVTQLELDRYSDLLARAVMDAISYFIGHRVEPKSESRNLAVVGAHVAHMLRDTSDDLAAGYYNIPRHVLEAGRISPGDLSSPIYRDWVRRRVRLARAYLREGKRYIRGMSNPRARLAGRLYCARFECVLDLIELDGFSLRDDYSGLPSLPVWLRAAGLRRGPAHHHAPGAG
jgi:phytoene/squalene synthetase